MVVRAQRFLVLRMSPGKHTPVGSSSFLAMGGMAGDAQGLSVQDIGQKDGNPSHRLLAGLQEHICKGEIVVREGQLSLLERCYGRNKGGSERGEKQVK